MEKIKVSSSQFHSLVRNYYKTKAESVQRLGQYIVNNIEYERSFEDPYSELFYCENAQFWSVVFKYIEIV